MKHISRIQCGSANCFCLEENGSAILIDTGWDQCRDKILDSCKGKNIRLIVLTHGHVDHIQNAAALAEALNAPIAMHKADVDLIAENSKQPLVAHSLFGKVAFAISKRNLMQEIEPFETGILLDDGDTLENYGVNAKIIGLPGHTAGSIGILTEDGNLFVGDALMNIGYPSKPLFYSDKEKMLMSAAKISACDSATIHFGHGRSVPNRRW